MPKLQIVVGSVEDQDYLRDSVKQQGFVEWIVLKETRVCDDILFLVPSFVGPILAVGNVKTKPIPFKDDAKKAKITYRADIDSIKFLNTPISLEELQEEFPAWNYLTYARAAHYVPDEVVVELMKMVKERLR